MTDDDLDRHLRSVRLAIEQHAFAAARDRLRLAVDAAVLAERERCAKIAEEHDYGYLGNDYSNGRNRAARTIAAAIRGDAS